MAPDLLAIQAPSQPLDIVDSDPTLHTVPHSGPSHSHVFFDVGVGNDAAATSEAKNDFEVPVQNVFQLLQSDFNLIRQADQVLEKQEEMFRMQRQHWVSSIETFLFQLENLETRKESGMREATPNMRKDRCAHQRVNGEHCSCTTPTTSISEPPLPSISEPTPTSDFPSTMSRQPSKQSSAHVPTTFNDHRDYTSSGSGHGRLSRASTGLTRGSSFSNKLGVRRCPSKGLVDDDHSCIARITRILHLEESEFAVALVILINAFVMGCECQYVGLDVGFNLNYPGHPVRANVAWAGAELVFTVCDWIFGALFFLEMLVKLICFRTKYFYDSDTVTQREEDCSAWRFRFIGFLQGLQGWNMLDFLCVAAFICSKIASSSLGLNPQMVRLLRLVRLFRLVRLLRFLETLDHLYIMTTSIAGLKRVMGWAIVLLTTMLFTCDLFLVQILQQIYFDRIHVGNLTDDELQKVQQMYAYFGTCTRCMLSMFEITLGNWPPVARLLSEEVSEWFTVVCLLHKLTIGFSVVGVITGVILQETFKVAQTDDVILCRQKKRASSIILGKMKNLFDALDLQADGKLSLSEFLTIGDCPDMKAWLASLDIETDDLLTLFDLIDVDANGYITIDELVSRVPRIQGSARCIDVLAMRKDTQQRIFAA